MITGEIEAVSSNKVFHIIFFIVLLFGFIFRLAIFPNNYAVGSTDVAQDYLVANHIVAYKEYPLVGPANRIYPTVSTSPFYYYFLALPLLVHNSMFTLGYVNILGQIVTIIALYFLAYTLFSPGVALLAGLLLVGNQQLIDNSFYMSQPWAAEPFFYSSYLLLAIGYTRKNYAAIVGSSVLFMVAIGLGLFGFPLLPVYLLFVYFALREAMATRTRMEFVFGGMIFLGLVFWAPVMSYLQKTHNFWFFITDKAYVSGILGYIMQFAANIGFIFDGWMSTDWVPQLVRIMLLTVPVSLLAYQWYYDRTNQRRFMIILCAFLFQAVLFGSLFQKTDVFSFIAGGGMVILLYSYGALSVWPKTKVGLTGSVISILLLVIVTVPTPSYVQARLTSVNGQFMIMNAVSAMSAGVSEAESQYGADWPAHIAIVEYGSYASPNYNPLKNIFWLYIEQSTHTKLTRISGDLETVQPVTAQNDFVFVVCDGSGNIQRAVTECIPKFSAQYPRHTIERLLYDGGKTGKYIVYLARLP